MNFLLDEYRKELLNIDQNSPYKREIFNTLKREIKNHNLCLVGLRQVGKTTLMLQLANWYFENIIKKNQNDNELITNVLNEEEKIFYTNVKSIKNVNLKENWELLLKEISTKKYQLIVLDEIQEINEWTNFLQAAIDLNKNAKFIVSGSNATALKQEIMVGRAKIFFINPLLFNEYKHIWNDNNIDNYLKFGSYPKNKNYSSAFIQYYELVEESIIGKIINEDNKKNIDGTKFFALISDINNYIGNEINYSKLENKDISRQTVSSYLKIMKEGQLIHFVPKYNDKNSTRKNKVYFEDKSMIYYFNKFEKLNNNLQGSLIENIVFNYLNYLFANNNLLDQIFYYRNSKEQEIDFVLPKQNILIECKYVEEIDIDKMGEQFLEIIKNNKELNDFKKVVITKNLNIIQNNIKFISLDKFLENQYEW